MSNVIGNAYYCCELCSHFDDIEFVEGCSLGHTIDLNDDASCCPKCTQYNECDVSGANVMKNNSTIDVLSHRIESTPICCGMCSNYVSSYSERHCLLYNGLYSDENDGLPRTKCCDQCGVYDSCCGKTIEALKFYEQHKGEKDNE